VRQVISWRFLATIGALVGLTALIYLAFGNNRSVAEVIEASGIDLLVLTSEAPRFRVIASRPCTEPPRATAKKYRTSSQSIIAIRSWCSPAPLEYVYRRHSVIRAARFYVGLDRFRTTDVRASALNGRRRRTHLEVLGGLPERPKAEPERKSHGKA